MRRIALLTGDGRAPAALPAGGPTGEEWIAELSACEGAWIRELARRAGVLSDTPSPVPAPPRAARRVDALAAILVETAETLGVALAHPSGAPLLRAIADLTEWAPTPEDDARGDGHRRLDDDVLAQVVAWNAARIDSADFAFDGRVPAYKLDEHGWHLGPRECQALATALRRAAEEDPPGPKDVPQLGRAARQEVLRELHGASDGPPTRARLAAAWQDAFVVDALYLALARTIEILERGALGAGCWVNGWATI